MCWNKQHKTNNPHTHLCAICNWIIHRCSPQRTASAKEQILNKRCPEWRQHKRKQHKSPVNKENLHFSKITALIHSVLLSSFGPLHTISNHTAGGSHQPVAVESGIYTPKEEPARPQVLQSEFKDEICQQHQRPHHNKLQEGVRTASRCRNENSVIMGFKCHTSEGGMY